MAKKLPLSYLKCPALFLGVDIIRTGLSSASALVFLLLKDPKDAFCKLLGLIRD